MGVAAQLLTDKLRRPYNPRWAGDLKPTAAARALYREPV